MKTKNLAVSALIGLLTLALWWNFLLKPSRSEASKVKAETATERTKLQPLQAQLAQANADAAHAGTFKARLAVLKNAVPDSPELANFIRDANAIADASNIAWQSVTHGPPTTGSAGVSTIAVGIDINGTYEQVLDYLGRIAALKRLVVLDNVTLSGGGTAAAGTGSTAASAGTGSTGPFSSGSTLTVTITGRMFLTATATVATGATGTPGAVTSSPAASTTG
jgi:Tfp pilus assembly protein PilO